MDCELRLHLDRFEPGSASAPLAGTIATALYVVDGALAMRSGDGGTSATLGPNSATSASPDTRIGSGALPARVLRWDLVEAGAPDGDISRAASSERLLAAEMRFDAGAGYLLRCDRVDFPAGGEALLHTHQGGGIRCLLFGSMRIETQGTVHDYAPMHAWFEAGPAPVYAAADARVPSAFARVMILPRALLGGTSSIRYVRPEDLDRPKSQRYQLFVDQPIAWPR
ncbi:MAG TPA: hypothetical protein VMT79_03835 [Candidatus Binatia bacterium]|nr:hypothetical protein [Candidatus Binatia bacterium]